MYGARGASGHARPPPPREVRHEHVRAEVELGLVEDDPPTRPSAAALEGRPQLLTQRRRGERVRDRGPRVRVQRAEDDLTDDVRR